MYHHIIWQILTDVSEELTASIRVVIEGVSTSVSTRLYDATYQKTAICKKADW
jgi:lysine/ornithine N-monooxygenase